MGKEMCSILMVERSYEQAYPQKLGKEFVKISLDLSLYISRPSVTPVDSRTTYTTPRIRTSTMARRLLQREAQAKGPGLAGPRHEMHGACFDRCRHGGTCFKTKFLCGSPRNDRPQEETAIDCDRHQHTVRQHLSYTTRHVVTRAGDSAPSLLKQDIFRANADIHR